MAYRPNKPMADVKNVDPFENNGIFSEKDLPEGIKRVLQINKMMDYINNPTTEKSHNSRTTGSYWAENIDTFKENG